MMRLLAAMCLLAMMAKADLTRGSKQDLDSSQDRRNMLTMVGQRANLVANAAKQNRSALRSYTLPDPTGPAFISVEISPQSKDRPTSKFLGGVRQRKGEELELPPLMPDGPIMAELKDPMQSKRIFELDQNKLEKEFDKHFSNKHSYYTMFLKFKKRFGLSIEKPEELSKKKNLSLYQRKAIFMRTINRIVSINYQDYLTKGGDNPRHLGVPECGEIGIRISNRLSQYADKGLRTIISGQAYVQVITLPESPQTSYLVKQFSDLMGQENFENERSILSVLHHANIISPICQRADNLELVFPYARLGDLMPDPDHPDHTILANLPKYMAQLISAIAHIHLKGFYHGDIKPENLVRPDVHMIWPIDFGSAGLISNLRQPAFIGIEGSPPYMSPEAFYNSKRLDSRLDYWSAGAALARITYMLQPKPTDWPVDTGLSWFKELSGSLEEECQWKHPLMKLPNDASTELIEVINRLTIDNRSIASVDQNWKFLLNPTWFPSEVKKEYGILDATEDVQS